MAKTTIFAAFGLIIQSTLAIGQEPVAGTAASRYSFAALSPDNKHIVAVALKGSKEISTPHYLHYVNRTTGKVAVLAESSDNEFGGHFFGSAAFSPGGDRLIAGGGECLYVWNFPGPNECFAKKSSLDLTTFFAGEFATPKIGNTVAYNIVERDEDENGDYISKSSVVLVNFRSKTMKKLTTYHSNDRKAALRQFLKISIGHDGKYIAVFYEPANRIDVFDVHSLKLQKSINLGKEEYIVKMAFSENSAKLWVLNAAHDLKGYDLQAKKNSANSMTRQPAACWMHACSNRPILLVASHDGKNDTTRLSFVNREGQMTKRSVNLGLGLGFVGISPDESLIIGCPVEGGIALWNIETLLKKAK